MSVQTASEDFSESKIHEILSESKQALADIQEACNGVLNSAIIIALVTFLIDRMRDNGEKSLSAHLEVITKITESAQELPQ